MGWWVGRNERIWILWISPPNSSSMVTTYKKLSFFVEWVGHCHPKASKTTIWFSHVFPQTLSLREHQSLELFGPFKIVVQNQFWRINTLWHLLWITSTLYSPLPFSGPLWIYAHPMKQLEEWSFATLFLFGSVAFMVQACKTMMIAFKTDIKHACIHCALQNWFVLNGIVSWSP